MKIAVVKASVLRRWDVKYLAHEDWGWTDADALPLGEVAVRRVDPVDRRGAAPGSPRLASIHFDGSITPRSGDGGTIAGRLFFARPGDLVFSKIDARHGAIGVVSEDLGRVAFTSEYPIYDVASKGRLRPAFLQLLCRTAAFRARVNALAVGHSGRKRVSPEALEMLRIPVPDVDRQDRILEDLGRRRCEADELERRAGELRAEISGLVLGRLGINQPTFRRITGPFVVRSKDVDRWALLRAMMAVEGVTEEPAGTYPVRRLGDPEIGIISYGVTKSPANRPGKHPRPYLRVANVQAGRLDLTNIKMIDVPDEVMEKYRLRDGDILLCEGNSLELVGRPALWRGEIKDCVHQNHVIKVRLNQEVLDPGFALAYMDTQPARLYILGRAKRTTNLASINSTDVAEFPIPVPPMDVQREIVREVVQLHAAAEELGRRADALRQDAFDHAERRISSNAANDADLTRCACETVSAAGP